jgi:CRISPR/Cas system-associated endonuclease Cas3-HD
MMEEQEEKKDHEKLGEILIRYKIITPEQLEEGLKIQKNKGKRIGEILINLRSVGKAVESSLCSVTG